ncbi:MAG: CHAT domain-containing protein [Anaerolineaceae bacterium]|nr:CHAT domain-containing protein [Anaerolineaceae bacterium]
MINPYAVRAVIRDKGAFYGRSNELTDIFTRLSAMQSCSIVGPRRIGKSSLLYHLTQTYQQHLPDAQNYIFAYIDLQELSGLGADDFFDTAVFELHQASEHPEFLDMDLNRYGNMREFRRLLIRLRSTGLKLVLCLDEFEMLSKNENFSVDFFTYLRGLCSNYDLALITSSRTSLYELCHKGGLQTSQFWNIFVELGLGLMSDKEALTLITEPFKQTGRELHHEEISFIEEWAGRHPFFIQTCCYHLFTTPVAELLPRFMSEAEPHFLYSYNQLTGEEQSIIFKLANGQPFFLSNTEFTSLEKQAIIIGSAFDPKLASKGWERFLLQQSSLSSSESRKMAALSEPELVNLSHLRDLIVKHFDENEVMDLCFDLRIEFEELVGNEKRGKTRSLINKLEREGRLNELIDHCAKLRPRVNWIKTPTQKNQTAPTSLTDLQSGAVYPDYENFSIKLEQLNNDSYRVLVLESPAGQDSALCKLPFNMNLLGRMMLDVGQMVTRGQASRGIEAIPPTELGAILFDTIFSGPVGQLFFESWGEVNNKGQGLRIKLHIDPIASPQLAALPWEYLCNNRRRRYFSLNRRTPIVRYLDVPAPTSKPLISLPLRILVAIAAPEGWPELDLGKERMAIEQAWGSQPNVVVHFVTPATPVALHQLLHQWEPHVLHFMGHGHFDSQSGVGTVLFENENGGSQALTGEQLGNLLANSPTVRLAFLNACETAVQSRQGSLDPFSGVANSLVMAGLPAVIAMQFPISDIAANIFAKELYSQLTNGEPIERAVSFGREAIHLSLADSKEWGTPALFMRVDNGHLFEFQN